MATANKPRVYVDSCCFIDVVKEAVGETLTAGAANDVWFLKKILECHRDGDLVVHTSILSVAECVAVQPGQSSVPKEVQERFRSLLTSGQFVQTINPTPKTATLVQRFRWDHGLVIGGADAIHLASALELGCIEFITNDDRLKKEKLQKAIPVLSGLGTRIIAASSTQQLPTKSIQLDLVSPGSAATH